MALTKPRFGQINTSIVAESDPITVLNATSTNANVDVGFLFNRASGLVPNVALYWSESSQSIVASYTSSTGATNSNISVSSYANVTIGNLLMVNGSILNVTGNILANTINATNVNGATIGNSGAVLYGTLNSSSAAQTNITSVGTLNGLTINSAAGMYNVLNITGTALSPYGGSQTWQFFTQNAVSGGPGSWITFPDTSKQFTAYPGANVLGVTSLTLSGNLQAGNVVTGAVNAATIGNTGATLTGTLSTASQSNVTTLAGLTSFGTAGVVTTAQGNLTVGNVSASGIVSLTNSTNTVGSGTGALQVAGGAYIAGNLFVGGNLNLTTSTTINSPSGSFTGNAAGFGALYAGILAGFVFQPQTTLQVSSNFNGYAQINSQNINAGAQASSDYIATADNGNANAGYIDMGIGSSTYNYSGFPLLKPNDGYLLVTGGTGTGGGNLILTTGTANDIVFGPNNGEFGRITSGNVFQIKASAASTSTTTGALTVAGGVGVGGNLYVAGNLVVQGTQTTINNTTYETTEYVNTVYATNINASTIGNTGAAHTGSTLSIATWANIAGPLAVTNNTAVQAIQVVGTSTKGGAGYHDFLLVTNQGGGTNPNKSFRLDSTGALQIINSAYTTNIFNLTDAGDFTIPGKGTFGNITTTNGIFWSNGAAYSSGSGGGGSFNGGTITGALTINNSTTSTSNGTGALIVTGGAGFSGNIWVDQLYASNNGNGTNVRIGDDVWLGDINIANTMRVAGVEDVTQGYIVFGNGGSSNYIGRSGSNPITVTGAFAVTGATQTAAITSSGTIIAATVNAATIGNTGATHTGNLFTVSNTLPTAQTAVLTHGADNNFQLTSQNGVSTNTTGTEVARFGINYNTAGWDSFTQYIRGSASQNGYQVLWAANTAIVTVQSGSVIPVANSSTTLGSSSNWWSTIYGTATHAQYADLAENYQADADYSPGTVVVFGGDEEITVTTISHDTRVAGVISTDPAYLMNASNNGLPVAFTGRVPCQVQGPVTKGQVLVTGTTAGVAQAIDNSQYVPGCVLGKALEAINTDTIETIEVVVGRF